MKCPKEIRQCPHNWSDCKLCAHDEACRSGTYVPEPELTEHELTVDLSIPIIVEPSLQEVQPRVVSVRGTWAERFLQMSQNDRMKEFYRYHAPSLHHKEPIPLDGGSSPGGGSKGKSPKKPQRKVPEYMKILGM